MGIRDLTAALVSLALLGGAAVAQTVREISGPAETPPLTFRDVQYVDSRGCVFVRAGVDGRTIWVPRVNAQRKVLCGYPPSLTAAAKPEPVAPPVSVAPVSAPVVAPKPATKPKRVAEAEPARQKQADDYIDPPRAGSAPGTLPCPARAPIAERVPLAAGGTVILCVSRPGLVQGGVALPPAAVAPGTRATASVRQAPVPAAPTATPARTKAAAPLKITLSEPADPIDLVEPVVPKGYKLAWTDGRLNAKRAKGTARGQAQQDLVWTQETPARLVTRAERAKIRERQQAVTISTKGAVGAARYVQVGSFADPANAAAATARLASLGLPVAKGRASAKGKPLQVVLAGPFADEAAARAALRLARSNGFRDAILR